MDARIDARERVVGRNARLRIAAREVDRAGIVRVQVAVGVERGDGDAMSAARGIGVEDARHAEMRGAAVQHGRRDGVGEVVTRFITGHRHRLRPRGLQNDRDVVTPERGVVEGVVGGQNGLRVAARDTDVPVGTPVAVDVLHLDRERDRARERLGRKVDDGHLGGVAAGHVDRTGPSDEGVALVRGGKRLGSGQVEHQVGCVATVPPGGERNLAGHVSRVFGQDGVRVGTREGDRAGVRGVRVSVRLLGDHAATRVDAG